MRWRGLMHLKIGYRTFKVLPLDTNREIEFDCDGEFRPAAGEISVNPKLAPEEQVQVFLHELLHACWWLSAIGEKVNEETAISGLAKALTTVLKDNPDLHFTLPCALAGRSPIVEEPRQLELPFEEDAE